MNIMNPADIMAAYDRHASPHVREQMIGCVAETASGAIVRGAGDMDLIDLASGGFGFGHPSVQSAVADKVRRGPLSSRILINRTLAELVLQLADLAPGDLSVSYVCNSGEEALDSALKLAKGYWPGRHKVVVAAGADYGSLSHGVYFSGHGCSYLKGLTFTPERLPFGDTQAFCQAIDDNTAAVILEPLSLEQGDLSAKADFWQALRQRCDQTGALLIINELRTGLGRTGKVFATQTCQICPDVLVVGGALSGGFVSVGAYITTQAINNKVYDRRNPSLHGSTTGANPASCAAALAALAVMRQDNFSGRHQAMGSQAKQLLGPLVQANTPGSLQKVQTCGSLTAMDADTPETAWRIRELALERGVLLRPPVGSRLLINPPLLISSEEHAAALRLLVSAIQDARTRTVSAPPRQARQPSAKDLSHEPT